MMTPKALSNDSDGSSDEGVIHNIKPSMVKNKQDWKKKSLKPFLKKSKVMERQNSYISTTTATSNTTQTDPEDPRLDGSEEGDESLVEIRNKSPPGTPSTVDVNESFESFEEDRPVNTKNLFLSRLEATLVESKAQVYHEDETDEELPDVKMADSQSSSKCSLDRAADDEKVSEKILAPESANVDIEVVQVSVENMSTTPDSPKKSSRRSSSSKNGSSPRRKSHSAKEGSSPRRKSRRSSHRSGNDDASSPRRKSHAEGDGTSSPRHKSHSEGDGGSSPRRKIHAEGDGTSSPRRKSRRSSSTKDGETRSPKRDSKGSSSRRDSKSGTKSPKRHRDSKNASRRKDAVEVDANNKVPENTIMPEDSAATNDLATTPQTTDMAPVFPDTAGKTIDQTSTTPQTMTPIASDETVVTNFDVPESSEDTNGQAANPQSTVPVALHEAMETKDDASTSKLDNVDPKDDDRATNPQTTTERAASPTSMLEKFVSGGLTTSLTSFVNMAGYVRRSPSPVAEAKDQSPNAAAPSTTAPRDFDFVTINLSDDAEDAIVENVDCAPVKPRPVAPKIRQLLSGRVVNSLRNILSKSPNKYNTLIPQTRDKEDEEAHVVESQESNPLKDGGESSAECELLSDDIMGNSSDGPEKPNDPLLKEAVGAKNEKTKTAERTISSRRSIFMICSAAAFAVVVTIFVLFFMEKIFISSAAVETASPSASMVPSSSPSLSLAPSDSPSSNPSLYPTISNIPTIAPSGHPTFSLSPSLVPSISAAPSPEPSIMPTRSMEPSETPSEVPSTSPSSNPSDSPSFRPTVSMVPSSSPSRSPSASPSARPTQTPTRTFKPSRSPSRFPTRRPSESPTDFPTRPPITPPPPVSLASAFKLRLYWNETYFWQETRNETWWCVECVKCAEYGNLDAPDHGCVSYGTGNEDKCRAGDSLWIRDCRGRGNRFNIQGSEENGFMVRIATTDLCVERIKEQHPLLFIQKCDRGSEYQRFLPWNDYNKFELRPTMYRGRDEEGSECVSQLHHPKSGEILALHNCALSRQYETLFWQKYL